MLFEIIFGLYLILFCLGFWTDFKLSTTANNKYYWLSLPLTAPIIGAKLVMERAKQFKKPKWTEEER